MAEDISDNGPAPVARAAAISQFRPIGWYLKEADRLITEVANAGFGTKHITRFHWQVLNRVNESGTAKVSTMAPGVKNFVSETELRALFRTLIDRGWVRALSEGDDLEVEFTDTGRAEFAGILKIQHQFFGRLMAGISEDNYAVAVGVLSRIIENLGGEA